MMWTTSPSSLTATSKKKTLIAIKYMYFDDILRRSKYPISFDIYYVAEPDKLALEFKETLVRSLLSDVQAGSDLFLKYPALHGNRMQS